MFDNAVDFDRLVAQEAEETPPSLFDRDCRWVSAHALRDPRNIPHVVALVALSIRQPFVSIAGRVADWRKVGLDSRFLPGTRRDAVAYAKANSQAMHEDALAFLGGSLPQADYLMRLVSVPGLGVAKGAFTGQLLTGRFACLDSLNLRAMGLHDRAFRADKYRGTENVRRVVETYLATCNINGTPAYWWDVWCNRLGAMETDIRGYRRQPVPEVAGVGEACGARISALHRLAIFYQ